MEIYGFIKFFCSSGKFYKVFLKKNKTFKFLKAFLRPVPFILNKKKLLLLVKKLPESLIVLNSSSGLICQKEALNSNIFGFLILLVY